MRSIKGELELKRDALNSAIQEGMDATRDWDQRRDMCKDPYGAATFTHDDEVTVAVVDRRARDLQEVNRALEDIEAGRYGVCRECGEAIAEARLKVLPFATRCVACQDSWSRVLKSARRCPARSRA